jgi:hypothetical protein
MEGLMFKVDCNAMPAGRHLTKSGPAVHGACTLRKLPVVTAAITLPRAAARPDL